MFPFFYLGILCSRYNGVKNLVFHSEWLYTVSIVLYVIAMFCMGGARKFAGCFAIVVLVQLFIKYDKCIPNIFSKTGMYSLEIYAFHWFVLPALPGFQAIGHFPQLAGACNSNFILLFVLSLFFAIPIIFACICITNVIRKSNLINAVLFGYKGK